MKHKATPLPKTSKAWKVYQHAHAAWRAKLLADFSYGQRGPDDPTIVWTVNGVEYAKDAHDEVRAAVDAALASSHVTSIEFGAAWVGYRELVVTFADGVRVIQSYNGREVVAREEVAA